MALTKAQREILKEEKRKINNEVLIFRTISGLSAIVLILTAINSFFDISIIDFGFYIVTLAMIGVTISWFKISKLEKIQKEIEFKLAG